MTAFMQEVADNTLTDKYRRMALVEEFEGIIKRFHKECMHDTRGLTKRLVYVGTININTTTILQST